MDLTHSRLLSYCPSPDFLTLPVSPSADILLCTSACKSVNGLSLGTGQRASGGPLGLSPYWALRVPTLHKHLLIWNQMLDLKGDPERSSILSWAIGAELKRGGEVH